MNDKMVKVRINNTHFFTGEEMNFFDTNSPDTVIKSALVFGKNGSGKSTISRLLNNFKGTGNTENDYINFYDKDDVLINEELVKGNIHCFDETFIDDNVKISEEGLRTIVMLGEQIDVDEQINVKNTELSTKQDQLSRINLQVFDDSKNTDSPIYHYNKIKSTLNLANGWAEMDRDIKGNKGKSKITQDVVDRIIKHKNGVSIKSLRDTFSEKMEYYEKVKDKTGVLNESISQVKISEFVTNVDKILYKHINKPIGDNWSDRLANTLNKKSNERLHEINDEFSKDVKYCPYCLRDIDETERDKVLTAIKTLQNRDVKDFESELSNLKVERISEESFKVYNEVAGELVTRILKNVQELNNHIDSLNNHIEERLSDVFTIPERLSIDFIEISDAINKDIKLIVNKVKQFNKDVKDSKKIKEELITSAMKIAYHSIKSDVTVMNQKEVDKINANKSYISLNNDISSLRLDVKALESKKNRTDIAQKLINEYLTIIFYDKKRLRIEDDNGKYIVYSFDKEVPPKKLSTGERNAIALCYFFTTINNNLDKNNVFTRSLLVVIDDPVTSFDVDNRIGIFSFLRSMLHKIFIGNEKSKVLIFTHKIDVFYDLQKALKDNFDDKEKFIKCFELKNKQLIGFKIESTYKSLLREVFEFAQKDNPDDYEKRTIGNVMRRVVESFSHFNYSMDINKITNEEKILEKVTDANIRAYFRDFMHRLLLNNESHMKDTVSSIETNAYYEYVNIEEKKKTAKSLLVFLYNLDEFHVTQNLQGLSQVELRIRQWTNEIKANISE